MTSAPRIESGEAVALAGPPPSPDSLTPKTAAQKCGGWTHIDVWVEWGSDGGTVAQAPTEPLFDAVADVAMPWGEQHGMDVHVSVSLNEDPPEWASA